VFPGDFAGLRESCCLTREAASRVLHLLTQVSEHEIDASLEKGDGGCRGGRRVPVRVPSSALGKAGAVAPSNRITVGCIGVGGMGMW